MNEIIETKLKEAVAEEREKQILVMDKWQSAQKEIEQYKKSI